MKERAKSSEVCVTDREKGGEVVENKIIDSKEIQDTSCRSTHTHTHTRPRHIHTHTHTHTRYDHAVVHKSEKKNRGNKEALLCSGGSEFGFVKILANTRVFVVVQEPVPHSSCWYTEGLEQKRKEEKKNKKKKKTLRRKQLPQCAVAIPLDLGCCCVRVRQVCIHVCMCELYLYNNEKEAGSSKEGEREEQGGKCGEMKTEEREVWDDTILRHVKFFIKSFFLVVSFLKSCSRGLALRRPLSRTTKKLPRIGERARNAIHTLSLH